RASQKKRARPSAPIAASSVAAPLEPQQHCKQLLVAEPRTRRAASVTTSASTASSRTVLDSATYSGSERRHTSAHSACHHLYERACRTNSLRSLGKDRRRGTGSGDCDDRLATALSSSAAASVHV